VQNNNQLHVVLGGSGGLGRAVVQALVRQNRRIRAVSRSVRQPRKIGNQVEVIRGDITDPDQMAKIFEGAAVIYHCANVPYTEWEAALLPVMKAVITAAEISGAKIVYGDNLYMYGPVTGLITPDLPNKPSGPKGMLRAQLALDLMNAHRSGRIRATIGRASDFFGPGVLHSIMGRVVFQSLVRYESIGLIGRIDMPHTYTFVRDFAQGLITLGDREDALGEIWHIPSAETLTTRQFLNLIFTEAKQAPTIQLASPVMSALVSRFSPMMREFQEISYEFEQPFIVDHRKYAAVFGSRTTPHREAIRQTIAWFRQKQLPAK
jgi:nucleoside-diphosphate-sugar epimerase